jgi:hypothetical protein
MRRGPERDLVPARRERAAEVAEVKLASAAGAAAGAGEEDFQSGWELGVWS